MNLTDLKIYGFNLGRLALSLTEVEFDIENNCVDINDRIYTTQMVLMNKNKNK